MHRLRPRAAGAPLPAPPEATHLWGLVAVLQGIHPRDPSKFQEQITNRVFPVQILNRKNAIRRTVLGLALGIVSPPLPFRPTSERGGGLGMVSLALPGADQKREIMD